MSGLFIKCCEFGVVTGESSNLKHDLIIVDDSEACAVLCSI